MAEKRSVVLLTSGGTGWSDVRSALASIQGISVVADVSTIDDLLAAVTRAHPNAVIMPARLGETSLLTLVSTIQQLPRGCRIIVLAPKFEPSELAEAISQGVADPISRSENSSSFEISLSGLRGRRLPNGAVSAQGPSAE